MSEKNLQTEKKSFNLLNLHNLNKTTTSDMYCKTWLYFKNYNNFFIY